MRKATVPYFVTGVVFPLVGLNLLVLLVLGISPAVVMDIAIATIYCWQR